jgi:hypothetical protein
MQALFLLDIAERSAPRHFACTTESSDEPVESGEEKSVHRKKSSLSLRSLPAKSGAGEMTYRPAIAGRPTINAYDISLT